MMKKNIITPVGLKGNEINERIKSLMNITPINENKSNVVVELTKLGPDGKAYAIIRENHEWYIKVSDKTERLMAEDFKYIGGLQNKKQEAYPSYAKAIKHLNLKFRSLAEAYNYDGEINVFLNDNLISERAIAAGFAEMAGHGFDGDINMSPLAEKSSQSARDFVSKEISHLINDKGYSHDRAVAAALSIARDKGYQVEEGLYNEVEMSEDELAIDAMSEREFPDLTGDGKVTYADILKGRGVELKETKLSIGDAIEKLDSIIESLTEGEVKKKL